MIKCSAEVTVIDFTDADHFAIWYYLSTSTVKPAAPQDDVTPQSPWTTTEPSFSEQEATSYLYTVVQTVWGDGSWSFGDVQLSSSYEAAKVAYNASIVAKNAAENLGVDVVQIKQDMESITTEVSGKASVEDMQQAIAESGDLIYDHTYAKSGSVYVFIASLRKNGVDVTDEYDPDRFVWYLRNEDGDTLWARGVTMTIDETDIDYRTSIIGGLDDEGAIMDALLVDHYGLPIVTSDGGRIIARTIWEDQ